MSKIYAEMTRPVRNGDRDLAGIITDAMRAKKNSNQRGEHFVLGWRLDPNDGEARSKSKDVHSCGCACSRSA